MGCCSGCTDVVPGLLPTKRKKCGATFNHQFNTNGVLARVLYAMVIYGEKAFIAWMSVFGCVKRKQGKKYQHLI